MRKFAQNLAFEKAQDIKEKIIALKNYQNNNLIVQNNLETFEVFSIYSDSKFSFVNYINIQYGSIVNTFTKKYKKIFNESDSDILIQSILSIRSRLESNSKKIITNIALNFKLKNVKIITPKIGNKKKIINFSLKNAKQNQINFYNKLEYNEEKKLKIKIIRDMKKKLDLFSIPYYIECFDNSNLQGSNSISSCIVFRNGLPSKKEYRFFNINNIKKPNDCQSISQVIYKRYSTLIVEKQKLPQLIIIDGGKGQLSAAYKMLNMLKITNQVNIISIAKKMEKIYIPNNSIPIILNNSCDILKIIKHARDEAHRFAVLQHRIKRNKEAFL